MTDQELIDHTKSHLRSEALLDLELIEDLREIHRRKLYLAHGTNSFHQFCTDVLGMSSDSAWRRMHAASLADRFPEVVKPLIAEGKVHLTGLAILDRVITPKNGKRLIEEAAGKTVEQIKAIVAREAPEQGISGVRKLPTKQLSETTWQFKAVMNTETKALLREVEDLCNGDDADAILREALKAYREVLRVKRQKALKRPRSVSAVSGVEGMAGVAGATGVAAATTASVEGGGGRAEASAADHAIAPPLHAASMRRPHDPEDPEIPRPMERAVRERDGHRCTFVGPGGRCTARRDLHVHHKVAVALGGLTVLSNLTLHCGAHNNYQAELDLGRGWANAWRKRAAKAGAGANAQAGTGARAGASARAGAGARARRDAGA